MAKVAKKGDRVKVHYTGRFESGQVFDSSIGREPLEFELGAGMIIRGFETAVISMKPGEKKTVTVLHEDGYGNYDENLLLEMPKDKIPGNINPEVGMELQLVNKQGNALPVVVKEILEKTIKLDANHPLAGKVLVFDLELLEII
ncbi:MAG: peptidylprolyl isomerase [Candidatus Aminicenantes bacterium]|nr:peptidylprolyl isomerase [Candidatus Aminicenantes bacterium]